MKRITLIAIAAVVAVLIGTAARVAAQNPVPSERTILTFSNTVEMPGVTLPAGTYVFRIADTPSRNVVQVLNQDESDILGQWTFVQASRPQVTGDTVVMFREAPEGSTPAVQYWYYPGERIGKEFIYPKDQAVQIANRTGSEVLTDEGRISANTAANGNAADREEQREAANADTTVDNAPASAQPSAAAGSLAGNRGDNDADNTADRSPQVADNQPRPDFDADQRNESRTAVGTSGVADTQAQADTARQPAATPDRADELPRTAGTAPLAGLIGMLSLAAALTTRRLAAARR